MENVYSENNPEGLINLGVAENSLMVSECSRQLISFQTTDSTTYLPRRQKTSPPSTDRLFLVGFGKKI